MKKQILYFSLYVAHVTLFCFVGCGPDGLIGSDADDSLDDSIAEVFDLSVGLFQAENRTAHSGCTTDTRHAGYTGSGFVDFGGNDTWIEWNNVNVPTAGSFTLNFRYANGSASARQCAVLINGTNVGNVAFSPTGAWTTWQSVALLKSLKAGNNTIRISANTSAGGPNLDSMEVKSESNGGSASDNLAPDGRLSTNQYLASANGQFRFYLQGDGNLVLRNWATGQPVWASGTNGKGGALFVFQLDSNLVLYTSSSAPVWSSSTVGSGATLLKLHDNGVLSLYRGTSVIWSVPTDVVDNCPDDPNKTEPGQCGCGTPEGSCGSDTLRFAAYGDTRTNSGTHQNIINKIASFNPELVLHTGDLWDGYGTTTWRNIVNSKSSTKSLLQKNLFLVARGNHESESDVINFSPSIVRNNRTTFSLLKGNVFFVSASLDPNASRSFISSALQSNEARNAAWRIVFGHYPVYSGGSHGASGQAAVESLFDQNGVDIYFCGHDHHYERSYQIYNKTAVDKDSDLVAGGGTVYIVSGGGGAPLYSVGNRWWTKTATSTNHYVELTATGALLSVRTKNLSGNTMDSFTISR